MLVDCMCDTINDNYGTNISHRDYIDNSHDCDEFINNLNNMTTLQNTNV